MVNLEDLRVAEALDGPRPFIFAHFDWEKSGHYCIVKIPDDLAVFISAGSESLQYSLYSMQWSILVPALNFLSEVEGQLDESEDDQSALTTLIKSSRELIKSSREKILETAEELGISLPSQ